MVFWIIHSEQNLSFSHLVPNYEKTNIEGYYREKQSSRGIHFTRVHRTRLFGDILSGLLSDFPLVGHLIILEHRVCVTLRWVVYIWIIQQVLNTEQYLFDSDGWFP